jgi:hypothetical protein
MLKRLEPTDEAGSVQFSTSRTANTQPVSPKVDIDVDLGEEASPPPLPVIDPDPIAPDMDLDIDLDVSEHMANSEKKSNNLIDFDMSDFVKPTAGKPPPKA